MLKDRQYLVNLLRHSIPLVLQLARDA
jgi:hypothetical protein